MDPSHSPAPVESRAAARGRTIAVVLLGVAALLLTFGLGWGVADLTGDDAETIIVSADGSDSSTPAEEAQPSDYLEERSEIAIGAAILTEIYAILEREFVDKAILDERALLDAAIRGALDSLNDPYTEYLSPSDLAIGVGGIETSYEGIGASVTDRSGAIQIVAPFRGSPAEAAGIRAGDVILAVDGESTEGWTDTQAVQRIRGPRGTEVVLTVQHTDLATGGAGPEIEDITIVRGQILIQSVFVEPLLEAIPGETGETIVDRDGNLVTDILYIHIAQFHAETPNELRAALAPLESGLYNGLILDMRGNPGGYLRQTVEAADEFLDEGIILIEIDNEGNRVTYGAREGGAATLIPIVIILDEASASGSEVLAAAIADNGRGTIVGVRSFGKGSVNQLHPLSECGDPAGCGAVYVTIGRWLRPNEQGIEGLGVAPDYEIPLTGDDYIDYGDQQLFAAIDVLRGQEPPPPPVREETDASEDDEQPDESGDGDAAE